VGPLRSLTRISSWWVLYTGYFGLLLVLLALRRWRHLLLWLVAWYLGSLLTTGLIRERERSHGPDAASAVSISWLAGGGPA
jgi:hypothetical protein